MKPVLVQKTQGYMYVKRGLAFRRLPSMLSYKFNGPVRHEYVIKIVDYISSWYPGQLVVLYAGSIE